MNESLKVPHMNIGDEYDVTRLSSIRQVLNKELASQNVKLSLTAFIIKAMSIAIDEYPIVNSKFNTTTQNSVSLDNCKNSQRDLPYHILRLPLPISGYFASN